MRRILKFLFVIVVLAGLAVAWVLFGSGTGFSNSKTTIYISSKAATRKAVMDSIQKKNLVISPMAFEWLADRLGYWDKIRPGKYEFAKGTGLLAIVRTLRNGRQTPVKLTITKLRQMSEFARMIAGKFEMDSSTFMAFLNNADSMRDFKVAPEDALTVVLPDTYTYNWNNSPRQILRKMADVSAGFWTEDKRQKATAQGLTVNEAYTLASIVEEETNYQPEKGNIASVYLNRMRKGMRLQADPTLKFALGDFTITRVLNEHKDADSPYNTYKYAGLPPGPICTPQRKTIEAVLDAPATNYLFFVVNAEKPGTHSFTETYGEHLANAKAYHEHLDEVQKPKPTH
jgi:UPF0755 protein